MEQDVISMETRLAQLKATMQSEREKRDSARGRNPTGAVWRSARTDVPVNSSSYVDKVLKSKDVAAQQAGQDAAAAKPTQPLLRAGSLPVAPPSGGPAPFGKTRASFDWNPSASLVDLGGDLGGDYEDLLGPEGGSNTHEPPPASGGGALLEGEFDEAANSAAFADAVREWRTDGAAAAGGGGGGPSQTGILLGAGRIDVGGSDRSVVAGAPLRPRRKVSRVALAVVSCCSARPSAPEPASSTAHPRLYRRSALTRPLPRRRTPRSEVSDPLRALHSACVPI
jgi:hypothetical protein